jgi:glycosyltransferase 2 family protein
MASTEKSYLKPISRITGNRFFRTAVGLIICLAALFLSFRSITLEDLYLVLINVKWVWAFCGLITGVFVHIFKTLRWRGLLGKPGKNLLFRSIFGTLMIGQMLNLVTPTRLGDISRAYQLGGLGPGRSFVLGTVLIEKILDMFGFAVLFVLMVFLFPLPGWLKNSGIVFIAVVAVASVIFFFVINNIDAFKNVTDRILHIFPVKIYGIVSPFIKKMIDSLSSLEKKEDLAPLIMLTTIIWGISVLVNWLIMLSLGIHLPWTAAVLLLLGLQAGISLPSVPGRIGVFEYICVLILTLFGLDKTTALGFGILLHLTIFVPIILSGGIFLAAPNLWKPRTVVE